jgi:pSer/pThr/pTyr-binding forkhead associated (FHA) protein
MASLDGAYVFELKEGENIVGREHGMKDYLLNKPYVSRKHAIFTLNDGKIYVENYSGTNFTFVNNQKITEKTELKVNDEIGLGGNEVNGKRQDGAAYLALRNI